MVWSRYKGKTDSQMVSLTHSPGTPWDMCYIEGRNNIIPDELTELYYKRLVELITSDSDGNR